MMMATVLGAELEEHLATTYCKIVYRNTNLQFQDP